MKQEIACQVITEKQLHAFRQGMLETSWVFLFLYKVIKYCLHSVSNAFLQDIRETLSFQKPLYQLKVTETLGNQQVTHYDTDKK